MRSDGDGLLLLDLLFSEPGIVEAEIHVEVLEVALSRLIADGTVEWMDGEMFFDRFLPRLEELLSLRLDHHAGGRLGGATGG